MKHLTLQAFLDKQWKDVGHIIFPYGNKNRFDVAELNYNEDYVIELIDKDDEHAVSINYPVALFFDNENKAWPRFIDDIMPSGASRRYWMKYLGLEGIPTDEQNYLLLKNGTMSPVGNLRIKESLPERNPLAENLFFTIEDVNNRAGDFLDYAQQKGAAAGGATGAGGEAPKLLLRCNTQQQIWIDTYQDDLTSQDIHYLVKYPRGSRAEIDCNILRAEYHFYHELEAMGFDTIATDNIRLEEGLKYPSIWLPRFDVRNTKNGIQHLGMESVYSMLDKGAGTTLYHGEVIRKLINKINKSHMVNEQDFKFDQQAFIIEWVTRDLLNIIFGNSDNHGRNTSFIRYQGEIRLAPIYDFAPMKADPEGVARTTIWGNPLEIGGEYDFVAIANSLSDVVNKDELLGSLKKTADQLVELKSRLEHRGIPEQILLMPSIGFDFISEKLTRWGLR
ncbi:type II toxin-antitoxin system HipA family toxin [Shewanella sp. 202IG2-18]|uniref:type II toxin-antitoxin system HipA family toxin n=1 Tax=Parashewanella hymeniacidonis TaxID=2807618 RepID=UPI001961636E|nr:HipA domain-containing protein [Parashewanella hymeniacidonis]MBM7073592.1 type II toxin-antitoxin system HipA family toxin [Parashewanella hymeniacidonis]